MAKQDRAKAILVIVATAGVIVFNILASTGYVNGVTPELVSARYPTALTPAGYAFSIWGLIYLVLAAFSVYQLMPAQFDGFRPIRTLYILSCVFNCAWIYLFHHDQIVLCLAVILLLWATLLVINIRLRGHDSVGAMWLARAPFGIYFGWVTAASLVSVMVVLSFLEMPAAGSPVLASTMIVFAAALAVVARWKLSEFFFPLAVAWALTAIAISHSGNTMTVAAAAVGVVICLVTTGSFVVNLRGMHE